MKLSIITYIIIAYTISMSLALSFQSCSINIEMLNFLDSLSAVGPFF